MKTKYEFQTIQYIPREDMFEHKYYEFDVNEPNILDYARSLVSPVCVVDYTSCPYGLQTLYSNWHIQYPYTEYPRHHSMVEGLAL